MNKHEQLQRVLSSIPQAVPEVEGALLASRDGLPIASTLGATEGSRVAAMSATVLALGARVVEVTELGEFSETVIQSSAGTFVVYDAGELATLAVLARGSVNLGLVHIEARRAAATLAQLLAAYCEEIGEEVAGPGATTTAATPAPTFSTPTPAFAPAQS